MLRGQLINALLAALVLSEGLGHTCRRWVVGGLREVLLPLHPPVQVIRVLRPLVKPGQMLGKAGPAGGGVSDLAVHT